MSDAMFLSIIALCIALSALCGMALLAGLNDDSQHHQPPGGSTLKKMTSIALSLSLGMIAVGIWIICIALVTG